MIAPVWRNKLIKISHSNQRFLIKLACCNSIIACTFSIISISTNNWLYTAEVLKYYIHPNSTTADSTEDLPNQPVYFKNATFGPWLFCWLDPATEFHCTKVDYFTPEEPYDVTTSVELSVRRAFIFMVFGAVLIVLGVINITTCSFREQPYLSLMCSSVLHIFSGMANFACIIVYMSAVSKEVGNKIYAATEMDDPLFHYSYGYSFIMLKISFMGNEVAALFSVLVYMAKRDERTFNRYQIRSLMAKMGGEDAPKTDRRPQHSRYRRTTRTASEFCISDYATIRRSTVFVSAPEEVNKESALGMPIFPAIALLPQTVGLKNDQKHSTSTAAVRTPATGKDTPSSTRTLST